VAKLEHVICGVRGSEFDENKSRLFVYCSVGTIYVWSYSGKVFTKISVKDNFLSVFSVN